MLNLILKDLLVLKKEKTAFIVLILCISIGALFPQNPGFASVEFLLGIYLIMVYANAFDYKYNAEIMINSLPLSRSGIVNARYLSALVDALLMYAVIFVAGSIIMLLGFRGENVNVMAAAFRFLLFSLFLLCINISFFLPVYFKLGYLKSRWANFIFFFVIFGLTGIAGNNPVSSFQGKEITGEVMPRLINILAGQESLFVYAEMLTLGIILVLISRSISVSIYKRKEF